MNTQTRQDYLKTELAMMAGMDIDGVQQMVACAMDCMTNRKVYGKGEVKDAPGYNATLIELYRRVHDCLPDKGVRACFHLACVLDKAKNTRQNCRGEKA